MLNQVVLVGRLTKDIEIKTTDSGKKITTISVAIPRAFKNSEGEYETDFIDCVLWNSVAENTAEYCKKGDIIGIKGRLECNRANNENMIRVVAEKVTFLSTGKNN